MFKRLETAWNDRTPAYLHPYTKENLIWQLKLTAVLVGAGVAYCAVQEYQHQKRMKSILTNEK